MSPVLQDEWAVKTHFQNANYFILLVINCLFHGQIQDPSRKPGPSLKFLVRASPNDSSKAKNSLFSQEFLHRLK